LLGITRSDLEGDTIRARLKPLEMRHPEIRFPRLKGRGKKFHAPRPRYDLRGLHTYLREAGLLKLSSMPEKFGTDIFNGMEKEHGDLIAALLAARDRPHAICQPLLSETIEPGTMIFAQSSPQLQTLQGLSKGLRIYAIAAINADQPEKAAQSIEAMLRLSEASTSDGKTLIHHLVAIAIRAMAIETMWEGLAMKVWDAEQLRSIQSRLQAINPRADFTDSTRAEAIAQVDFYKYLKSNPKQAGEALMMGGEGASALIPLLPWLDHNKARGLQSYHRGVIAPLKTDLNFIEIGKVADAETEDLVSEPRWNPRKILATLSLPAINLCIRKTAESEALRVQAATACALEGYFIEHKVYPDTLQALVPKFTKVVPNDPMDGQPIRYKKTSDGRYQLHSIGWDGNDDGAGEGDITWNYLAPQP
jgi:hypothetical protein